ncbi:MAG: pilus assembly protein TadB [Propionibacteriaceae bacterium]|jgi:tight adherence protein B|nr:pilus assembly protein TadB [Propionibacteriaceae bacterium]
MTVLAAVLAGLAAFLWVRPGRPQRRLAQATPRDLHIPPLALVVPVGLAGIVLGLAFGAVAVVVSVAILAGTVGLVVYRRRRDQAALAAAREVARACRLLDGLLAQGDVPVQALVRAAQDCPLLAPAAAAAHMGGDPAAVLRDLSRRPGASGLADVARAWQLTERTGAPLHGVLGRAKANLLAQADLAAVAAQELSASKASGQMLAVLPLLGLVLSFVMGSDPLGFLIETTPGRACLIGGIGLMCGGALWTDVLASRAARLSALKATKTKRPARRGQATTGARP